jgi:hypothetical protein
VRNGSEYGTRQALALGQSLTKLDRQRSGLDGLDALPAALGLVGAADDAFQPGGLVFVGIDVGIRRRRPTGLRLWRKSLIEQAGIFRSSAVVGVGGL